MTTAQALITELAAAHGCDAETIVAAAVMDFALGKSHAAQAQVLQAIARLDAAQDDNFGHLPPNG